MKIDTLENCGTELDDETINNKTTFTDFDVKNTLRKYENLLYFILLILRIQANLL